MLQPAGTLGTLGRGTFIVPNLRAFDFSLAKNVLWKRNGDDGALQFRAEFFNPFNRPNFGPPALVAFASSTDNELPPAQLGRIRATVTSARQIQFGLRFVF